MGRGRIADDSRVSQSAQFVFSERLLHLPLRSWRDFASECAETEEQKARRKAASWRFSKSPHSKVVDRLKRRQPDNNIFTVAPTMHLPATVPNIRMPNINVSIPQEASMEASQRSAATLHLGFLPRCEPAYTLSAVDGLMVRIVPQIGVVSDTA